MLKFLAVATASLAGVITLLSGNESWAQTKELKFANFIPTAAVTYTDLLKPWIDGINEKLGSKYQIRGYWGGTLGRDPSQYSKMVRDGVADLAMTTFGESASVFPDTTVFELPFLTRSSLEGSLAHWRLHNKVKMTGYDEFKWLGLWVLPPYQFHFAKPIRDLESLKGLKVRSGGGIQTKIVEMLGMTPVSGPVTSAAEALSRGTWDGIFIEWSAGKTFGVHKVAKSHYEMNIASIALGVAMNKKVYDGMDAAARKVVDDFGGENSLTRGFGTMSDNDRELTIREIKQENEQAIVAATDVEIAKAKKAMEPIIGEWLKSNPRNPQIYEAVNQILADLRK